MDLNHYEINMTQIHQKDKETACFIDILKKTYNKLFDEPISNCTLVISHHDTHDRLVSQANYYYGTNDIKRCLFVIYQLLKLYPTKFESVYILFLVLDDIGDKQNSYICYCKYIEKSKKEDEIYHAYTLSKELEYDIDTAHYICRLQTFGNHRHYVEEKIRLYDKIYKGNICNKFFYFKKIFTMFEIMYFDGYIYRIGDFVNELNQYAVKRILNILDQLFVTKAPEIDYLHEFIDYCFEYKEYNLYLTYKKKDSRIETVDDKLRILIAKEVCNDNSQDIKNIMSKIDAMAIDYGDPYLQYQEFCVESHNYTFKSNAPTSELFNDEIYTRITDLHFCLLDLLLTNSKLSSAEYIIDKLINTYQITDVGINKLTEESIDNIVINDIDTYRNKTILYIGMYLQKMQKNDLAILLLTKLYSIDYSNEDLKRLLNDLHKSKGDIDTANLYEKMLDVEKKKKITSKKVLKTREKYDKLLEILNNIHTTEGKEIYIKQSRKLIKKFFNNSYVYRENKTSKTIRPRKYKRLKHYMKKLKSISYRDRSKSERRKIFREFRNFHGLLFCEWHYIIKNLIFAYFDTGNYKKGMNIIIKFLQGHFFNKYMIIQIDYFYNIAYIGIKAGLTNNDLKSIISICKKLTFDCYPLLYYFTNYFENYGYSHEFRSLQRNLKRLTMRNGSNELCDSQTWEKICNGTMTEFTSSIYKSLDYDSKVKLLSAYYPRYIHKISAKMLLSVITDDMGLEESIMLSTIMLNHSLSKKLTNGEVYMEAGFDILFEAQKKYKNNFDKLDIVLYNIGRAYQLFGILGWAEVYYRKCIFAKGRVKDYALNNLSRLYNLNDKKDLYFDALNMIE